MTNPDQQEQVTQCIRINAEESGLDHTIQDIQCHNLESCASVTTDSSLEPS